MNYSVPTPNVDFQRFIANRAILQRVYPLIAQSMISPVPTGPYVNPESEYRGFQEQFLPTPELASQTLVTPQSDYARPTEGFDVSMLPPLDLSTPQSEIEVGKPLMSESLFEKENPAWDRSTEINKIRLEKTKETKSYADIFNVPPDEKITIWRAVPTGGKIEAGDFVTQDKEVAKMYGNQMMSRGAKEIKWLSKRVSASEIKLHPSHQAIGVENEFIYSPKGNNEKNRK